MIRLGPIQMILLKICDYKLLTNFLSPDKYWLWTVYQPSLRCDNCLNIIFFRDVMKRCTQCQETNFICFFCTKKFNKDIFYYSCRKCASQELWVRIEKSEFHDISYSLL